MTPWQGLIHKAEQRERALFLEDFALKPPATASGVGESSPTKDKGKKEGSGVQRARGEGLRPSRRSVTMRSGLTRHDSRKETGCAPEDEDMGQESSRDR